MEYLDLTIVGLFVYMQLILGTDSLIGQSTNRATE